MTALVGALNSVINPIFRLLFAPFASLHHWWPMLVISALTALIMLWIFGKVSKQEKIRAAKSRIRGNLLGVRLFQHDVAIVMRMQAKILKDTFYYAGLSMVPMLVLLLPVALIIIQLNLYFAAQPLATDQAALVKVDWRGQALVPDLKLTAEGGVVVETEAVRVASESGVEVWWRIRGDQPIASRLKLEGAGVSLEKEVSVGSGWGVISTLRTQSALDLLLYPGEAPIEAGSSVFDLEIQYPEQSFPLLGWDLHWLLVFFALSVIFSFAFKGFMGVEL